MITLANERDLIFDLFEVCPQTIQMKSALLAYGCDKPFAMFYVQRNDSGKTKAILLNLDGRVVYVALPDADMHEIERFIQATASSTASYGAAVMKYIRRPSAICEGAHFNCRLTDVYKVMSRAFGKDAPDFDGWYVDMSHRIRHDAAASVLIAQEGRLLSSACALIDGENALLFAVSAFERRRGYGAFAVSSLCRYLSDRLDGEIMVCAKKSEYIEFYNKNGFTIL